MPRELQVEHSTWGDATITIVTNNVPRDVIYGYDLKPEERKEFDYLTWDEPSDMHEMGTGFLNGFIRYKGQVYDINEFERATPILAEDGWDGQQNDTFFSGILFKWVEKEDFESVIMGRFYG